MDTKILSANEIHTQLQGFIEQIKHTYGYTDTEVMTFLCGYMVCMDAMSEEFASVKKPIAEGNETCAKISTDFNTAIAYLKLVANVLSEVNDCDSHSCLTCKYYSSTPSFNACKDCTWKWEHFDEVNSFLRRVGYESGTKSI